jgi:drug/metabolite transporter (DMT)-like permease
MVCGLVGIMLMLFGGDDDERRPEYTPTLLAYIALLFNPLAMSLSQVAMRQMKKLPDTVVSFYMVVSYLAIFLPISVVYNYDLSICTLFSGVDWLCIVFIGVGMVVMQTLRFKAISCHPLSGLQPYSFLVPLQQMLTDVLLFELAFTGV